MTQNDRISHSVHIITRHGARRALPSDTSYRSISGRATIDLQRKWTGITGLTGLSTRSLASSKLIPMQEQLRRSQTFRGGEVRPFRESFFVPA